MTHPRCFSANVYHASPRIRLAQATAHANMTSRLRRHGATVWRPGDWFGLATMAERVQRQAFSRRYERFGPGRHDAAIFRRSYNDRARAVARLAVDGFLRRPPRRVIPLRSI